ncbi:hypothetical protein GGX14DRAFT_554639 [Mycena pura]|uniref:Uncharacterized protein n=1 Tax=Mycena pura TaxID=153505 RepID=A0AAD7E4M6_9AGAR|nr:hypothetical protein GGX14DRAFT_554639 [Mycena pura]
MRDLRPALAHHVSLLHVASTAPRHLALAPSPARRPLPAPVPCKSRRPSPVVFTRPIPPRAIRVGIASSRLPRAIRVAIASRRSPPTTRVGIGAQRTHPRPAAPTAHFPCGTIPAHFPLTACYPLPAHRSLSPPHTSRTRTPPAACCILRLLKSHSPSHAALCTRRLRTTLLRSFSPSPTPDTYRPPHAACHARVRRDEDATTYYLADGSPSGGALTLRFGHSCVHEHNMAGVVRRSGRPAMLSAVEGSCTLCATFTLLQTPSAVATAGARDAPAWTRRASCLMLDARRPPLTARHQLLAARGSPPPAVSVSRKIQRLPRATWHLPRAKFTPGQRHPLPPGCPSCLLRPTRYLLPATHSPLRPLPACRQERTHCTWPRRTVDSPVVDLYETRLPHADSDVSRAESSKARPTPKCTRI